MADRMSHAELRALSTEQLEARINRLDQLREDISINTDTRNSVDDALTASESVLENKRLLATFLDAHSDDQDALARTYFRMSTKQLAEAFEYHVTKQRELFYKYLQYVDHCKERLQDNDEEYDTPAEPKHLTDELEEDGLPSLVEVMPNIHSVPIKRQGTGGWTTLRKAIKQYNWVMGIR